MSAPALPGYRGDFVAGEFLVPGKPDGEFQRRDPGDLTLSIPPIPWALDSVDRAAVAARAAQPAWERRAMGERLAILRAYQKAVERRGEEIAGAITREMGKPLWEARQEVATMVAKVDHTLDHALRLVEPIEVPGGRCRFKARGVLAILGPFNFPGHLPAGHFVPALAAGNAVVLKAPELAPFTVLRFGQIFLDAGLPPGVVNILPGGAEAGASMVAHPGIDKIQFIGSDRTAKSVLANAAQTLKPVGLELGGK
ncbi:MAG: aldehyde dehydrogenase family protein, partial [Myxococcales bacterium]|nr:aldehyde dehydrogenase family protein [Myxococcales bacterium]